MGCDRNADASTPLTGEVPTMVPWHRLVPSTGFYVYRLFGLDDALLYVGCTKQLRTRLRTHARSNPAAVRASFVEYGTRKEAEAAELLAIQTEMPTQNVALGTGRYA